MTTFQGERHIREQLDAFVRQSRLPDEIVVSDDASTDRTLHVVEEFAERSPVPVRILARKANEGLRCNVEDALRAVRGSITVLADQDDTWSSDKIAEVVAAFDDPDVTLWFSDADLIDDDGRSAGGTQWEVVGFHSAAQEEMRTGAGLRRLLQASTVTGATMAFRSAVRSVALPLPLELTVPGYLFLHDGWIAVLAHVLGRTVVEPRALTHYRQHADQFTRTEGFRASTPSRSRRPGGVGSALDSRERHGGRLLVDHARTKLVAERLRNAEARSRCRTGALAELDALERFLDVRVGPRGARGRRTEVLRHLAAGHYTRFSSGVRTAALDLL